MEWNRINGIKWNGIGQRNRMELNDSDSRMEIGWTGIGWTEIEQDGNKWNIIK